MNKKTYVRPSLDFNVNGDVKLWDMGISCAKTLASLTQIRQFTLLVRSEFSSVLSMLNISFCC